MGLFNKYNVTFTLLYELLLFYSPAFTRGSPFHLAGSEQNRGVYDLVRIPLV